MNLLSLLIAPLQIVVLFFAPHAANVLPQAVTAKPAGVRLPSRWLAAQSSTATANFASGHAGLHASRSAHPVGIQPLHAVGTQHMRPGSSQNTRATSTQRMRAASTQRMRAASITYPQAVTQVTAKPIHRVRVVRHVDAALPADRAGRMLVSGRFADVCAELDRLATADMRAVA